MTPIVLYSHHGGNSHKAAVTIAQRLQCLSFVIRDAPDVSLYSPIILVIPNTGDEELPQQVEDYLCGLAVRGKPYHLCELGSYFGLDEYQGCKLVVTRLLADLGWRQLSVVSIDSFPTIDMRHLREWIRGLTN